MAKKDDLEKLEAIVALGVKAHRKAIEALRTIRAQDLFKPEYDSFDDYMEVRWGRTRQWATQEIAWVKANELLEKTGKKSYQFSVGAVQPARYLIENDPDGFVEVYTEAAQQGEPVTANSMKEALDHYKVFNNLRTQWEKHLDRLEYSAEDNDEELPNRPAPLNREEADSLARITKDWSLTSYNPNLVEEAQARATKEGKPWQEVLVDACLEAGKVPVPNDLLEAVRGEQLSQVCKSLEEKVLKEWEETDIAKEALKELDKKRKELLEKIKKPEPPKPEPDNEEDDEEPEDEDQDEEDEDETTITDEEAQSYLATLKAKMEQYHLEGDPQEALKFVADLVGIEVAEVMNLLLA